MRQQITKPEYQAFLLSKGSGEERLEREGEKGLTQTFLLAYVEHPDSGRCADWIIYNAPRRHTNGNKKLRLAASRTPLARSCCFAFFLPFFPSDFRAKERLFAVYEYLSRDKMKFTVNMLFTCILYRDAEPGCD